MNDSIMSGSTSSDLSPEQAQRLYEEGAFLVFLDVPPPTEVGIDLKVWNVGPKFKGIKMIPPGIHFIYYSAVSNQGEVAPRTGFFHSFRKGEVLLKKWDPRIEDISEEKSSEEEIEKIRRNLKSLDKFLGPYPYELWKKWISLTSSITVDILERMQPLNKKIASVSQLIHDETPDEVESPSKRSAKKSLEEKLLPKMILQPGTEIRFTKLPTQKYPEGSSAADITRHNLDLSYSLEKMMENFKTEDEILGELQLTFVCFVIGQVYEAFEHWKELMVLLCSCDRALVKYADLYSKFIFTIYHQIQEIPQDFFVDIVSRSNFLTTTLHSFFMNLQGNAEVDSELLERGNRFQKYLTKKFRWDFQSEPDEDAPIIVDLKDVEQTA